MNWIILKLINRISLDYDYNEFILIGLNWTILFKCLEMTIVVIWRYINKLNWNWIELCYTNKLNLPYFPHHKAHLKALNFHKNRRAPYNPAFALYVHWIPKSVTDTAILNLPRGAPSILWGIKPPPHHSPLSLRAAHRHVHFCRASSLLYIGNEWQMATSGACFVFGVNPGLGKIVSSSYLAIESCHH